MDREAANQHHNAAFKKWRSIMATGVAERIMTLKLTNHQLKLMVV